MIEFKAILDVDAAMVAVERNGYALQYVPDELKSEAMCAKAVERDGDALQYIPDELKSEAVCAKAVESNGDALQYVPDELKSEAVCAKAVESNGDALQYIPDELKSEAVCAKAVERNGYALRYVLKKSLFISIAAKFGIPIDIKDQNEKAMKAYAAYRVQAGGVTFDGKPLPTFDELGEERQACWIAAVDAI